LHRTLHKDSRATYRGMYRQTNPTIQRLRPTGTIIRSMAIFILMSFLLGCGSGSDAALVPDCQFNCTEEETFVSWISLIDAEGDLISPGSLACQNCKGSMPATLHFSITNRAPVSRNQTYLTFSLSQGEYVEMTSICLGIIPPESNITYDHPLGWDLPCNGSLEVKDLIISWSAISGRGCEENATCSEHQDCWRSSQDLFLGCGGESASFPTITTVWVSDEALLVIEKAGPATALPGSEIVYTVRVRNAGGALAEGVEASDTLPAGLNGAFVSHDGLTWKAYASKSPIDLGDIGPGESRIFYIKATVDASLSDGTQLVNRACLASGECATSSTTVRSGGAPDLTIEKWIWGSSWIDIGSFAMFIINVENTGSGLASGVTIRDLLPSGMVDAKYSIGGSSFQPYTSGDPIPLGDIPAGTIKDIEVEAKIDESVSGGTPLTNRACIDGGSCDDLDIRAVWPLDIHKTGPSQANTGDQITYTITAENRGSFTVADVEVMDFIPNGIDNVEYSIDGSSWSSYSSGQRISFGPLSAGASRTFFIRGTVTATYGTLYNQALVKVGETGTGSYWRGNGLSTKITGVASLYVNKWSSPYGMVNPGEILEYTIEVKNDGLEDAHDVEIEDTLPPSWLENVQYSRDRTSWQAYSSGDTIYIGRIGATSREYVYIKGQVSSSAPHGTYLTNEACITGASGSYVIVVRCDSVSNQIWDAPRLYVDKDAPARISPGEEISYSIDVENDGTRTESLATLVDNLPSGLIDPQYSFDGSIWNPYASGDTIDLVDIVVGETRNVLIRATVDTSLPEGTILTNTVDVTSQYSSDSDYADTLVSSNVLEIVKAGPAQIAAGSQINYEILVKNNGGTAATGVSVREILPSGLQSIEYSTDGSTWQPIPCTGPGNCYIAVGDIPGGQSRRILVRATVDSSLPDGYVLENTACVGAGICDTVYTTIASTAPRLGLTKTASVQVVAAGDGFVYTITYRNEGTLDLHDVVIQESYPAGIEILSLSPLPDPGTNNRWTIGTLRPGEGGQISIIVKVPESANISFNLEQSATGSGFVNSWKGFSTEEQPYTISNTATISSRETGAQSGSSVVTVSGETGTEVSLRESGSGSYAKEEMLALQRSNRSIREESSLSAVYHPFEFPLPGGRSLAYADQWTERTGIKNHLTSEAVEETYLYADRLERDSRLKVDEDGTEMDVEADFDGSRDSSYLALGPADAKGHRSPLIESLSRQIGSFHVAQRLAGEYSNRSDAIGNVTYHDEPHITIYQCAELADDDPTVVNLTLSILNDGNRTLGPVYLQDVVPAMMFLWESDPEPSYLHESLSWANWTVLSLAVGESQTVYLRLGINQVLDVPINRAYVTARCGGSWVQSSSALPMDLNWLSCSLAGGCNKTEGWQPPDWDLSARGQECPICVQS